MLRRIVSSPQIPSKPIRAAVFPPSQYVHLNATFPRLPDAAVGIVFIVLSPRTNIA
jgi:hypothetical protein